jgi:hypothetical protein
MFLAQNVAGGSQQQFPSRDQLLGFLEQENAKVKSLKQETDLTLMQVTEAGEILQKKRISLPFVETVEELLLEFGFVQTDQKKKFPSFFKLEKSVPQSDAEQQATSKAALEAPRSLLSSLKFLAPIFLLILLLGGYTVVLGGQNKQLKNQITELKSQVGTLSNLQEAGSKVDVFGRYFVATLFANNKEQVQQYLNADMQKKIEVKDGQLQSTVFESIKPKGKGYEVTYVLYVNQENSVRLVRLTFDVVADKDSRFGWLVTSQPTESLYPG